MKVNSRSQKVVNLAKTQYAYDEVTHTNYECELCQTTYQEEKDALECEHLCKHRLNTAQARFCPYCGEPLVAIGIICTLDTCEHWHICPSTYIREIKYQCTKCSQILVLER